MLLASLRQIRWGDKESFAHHHPNARLASGPWYKYLVTKQPNTCLYASDIEKILVGIPETGFTIHDQELLDWNDADAIFWEISFLMCPRIRPSTSFVEWFLSYIDFDPYYVWEETWSVLRVRTKTQNHGKGASNNTTVAFQQLLASPGCRVHNSEPAETTKSFLQVGKYLRKWEMWAVNSTNICTRLSRFSFWFFLYTPYRLSKVVIRSTFVEQTVVAWMYGKKCPFGPVRGPSKENQEIRDELAKKGPENFSHILKTSRQVSEYLWVCMYGVCVFLMQHPLHLRPWRGDQHASQVLLRVALSTDSPEWPEFCT